MPLDKQEVALIQSLEGRKIVRTKWFDPSPDQEWADHEQAWLWLDDGRVICFSPWGYDASAVEVEEIEVIDVAECLHCHQTHPEHRVLLKEGHRVVFCTDGNHIAWEEEPG